MVQIKGDRGAMRADEPLRFAIRLLPTSAEQGHEENGLVQAL